MPMTSKKKNASPGCLICFFGIFFLVGIGLLYMVVIQPMLNSFKAQSWQATPCEIVSSKVGEHRGNKGGRTYSVDIEYDYEFNGQKRHAKRYDFSVGSEAGRNAKQAIVNKYPPGLQTTCYVDPKNPDDAVIDRVMPFQWLPIVLSSVFALVGFFGMFGTMYSAWYKTPVSADQQNLSARRPTTETFTSDWNDIDRAGPATLKPKSSPIVQFLVVVGISIFWNGIVSIFLVKAINELKNGGFFAWFLLLFMVPFVLVGLGLIAGIFYSFFSIFNPRPELVVSTPAVQLGFPLEVEWRFNGSTRSIKKLRIYLEGKESASYQRGTTRSIDTSVFAELTVTETTQPLEIAAGKASITVPFTTMHTWKAASNEIEWSLWIIGEIGFWPNVSETFPYHVRPVNLGG